MPLPGFLFTSLRHQSTTPEQGELSEDRGPQEVTPRLPTLATTTIDWEAMVQEIGQGWRL